MKSYNFNTPVEAWSSLMEKAIYADPEEGLFSDDQGAEITGQLFTYGLHITIDNPVFDPDFDFGTLMGYTSSKWTTLLNNYLDLDAMDTLKTQIRENEKMRSTYRNYHIGFHFADSHNNGKGCLLSGVFSRKINQEKPQLTVIMRASEMVTRLPWDLLLISRIGEYVYGHTNFTIQIIMVSAFIDDVSLMLYNGYKNLEEIFPNVENKERRKKLKKIYKKVTGQAEDGEDPKYQAYLRVYKVFNPEKYGMEVKPLLAKDCIIGNWDDIPMPKGGCPSIIKRNAIKAAYTKFIERYGLELGFESAPKKKVISFQSKPQTEDNLGDIEDEDNLDNSNETE